MKITFKSADAACCFYSMAEGIGEIHEREGQEADSLLSERLLAKVRPVLETQPYPVAVEIDGDEAEAARWVIQDCYDNGPGSDDSYALQVDDVTIED